MEKFPLKLSDFDSPRAYITWVGVHIDCIIEHVDSLADGRDDWVHECEEVRNGV